MARPKHKFKAIRVEDNGEKFPSKLEWRYFKHLQFLKNCGKVIFFLRQVPIGLPGGIKYVVDYQVFNVDGSVSFVDVKGIETETFKIKRKIVEDLYPFKIDVVKDGDF